MKTIRYCMDTSLPPPLPPPPPPILPATSPARSFPRQAATFSLVAPLMAIGIGVVLRHVDGPRIAMIVLGLPSTLLIASGLVLGIMALAATKRHGRSGIFGKALAGTCLNGLFVLLMILSNLSILGLIKAWERFEAKQRQQMEQKQP
jgi:hypothetical protein